MITNSLGGAIKRVDTLNNAPKVLQNLGFSAEDAAKAIEGIDKGTRGLPTSLDQIAASLVSIASASGLGIEEATELTVAFNNMALAGGKGPAEAERALVQFTQALGRGKFQAQDFNTLMEVMPAQLKQVAKTLLGASSNTGKLRDALTSGEVSMDDFNDAVMKLNKKGGKGFASFADQAKTATGGIGTSISLMGTSVTRGLGNIMKAIGTTNITGAFEGMRVAIDGAFAVLVAQTPAVLAVLGQLATSVGDYLGPKFSALWNTIQNQFIPALQNTMAVLAPFALALGTTLVVAVGLAVDVFSGLVGILSSVLSNTQLLQSVIIPLTVAFVAYKGAIMAVNAVHLLQAAYAAATGTSYMLLNGQLVAVRTATIAQTVAQKALNLAMSMNPIGLVTAAVVGITAAYIAATAQTDNNKSAEDRLSDARRAAKVAGDNLKATEDKLKGARLGVEGSTLQVERAQRTYTDAVAKYGPKSLEAREAAYQLKRANEDLKAANDKVKEATNEKRKAEEEVVKKKQAVKDAEVAKAVEFYKTKDSIVSQTNSLLALKGNLDGLNGKNFKYTVTEARRVVSDGVSSPAAKQAAADRLSQGYALGGFTGRGGKYDIAGIVHKGEYVLPKELVNQSTGLPKSFSNSNASSDFGDNSQPLIINVGGERLVDTVIEGINGRSFLGGSSVINV